MKVILFALGINFSVSVLSYESKAFDSCLEEVYPCHKRIFGKNLPCYKYPEKEFCWDDVYPPKNWIIQSKWLKMWAIDFLKMQIQLFTWDTMKILAVLLPAYFGTRTMDKDFQYYFYDGSAHRNIHQVPKWLCELSDKGIPAMIGILSSFSFFSNNPEVRLTSYVYTQATISYWIVKNIFKNSTYNCQFNARPKHEGYCKDCTAYGGFPSGHAGEAVLAAILFGMRHGPKWGVPLGIYATLVFGVSISSNRHYLSQVIGGVGLGMIYGVAAYNLIKSKFPYDISCGMSSDSKGRAMVNIGYSF